MIKIKSSVEKIKLFDFNLENSDDISKVINSLHPTKKMSGANSDKIVKLTNKQIYQNLANFINQCKGQNKNSSELKMTDITPILKKRIH